MQAGSEDEKLASAGRRRATLPLLVAGALGAGGFCSTYFDLWSPIAMIGHEASASTENAHVGFVDVPTIELPLPGGQHHSLVLTTKIETTEDGLARIQHLMPRVLDNFNAFLAGVDPAAFDKRGVLEIVKLELTARAQASLQGLPVNDVLITEFRLK